MYKRIATIWIAVCCGALNSLLAAPQDAPNTPSGQESPKLGETSRASGASTASGQPQTDTVDFPASEDRIRYIPRYDPSLPTHQTRVLSAARAAPLLAGQPPLLYVLVPKTIALTTLPQPCLFWYLSQPVDCKIRINIEAKPNDGPPQPLFDPLTIDGSEVSGIQRLDLAKLGGRLQPGVRYDWVVSLDMNPKAPSNNPFAKISIWRVVPDPSLDQILASTSNPRQRAATAAAEGLWIDAMQSLSELIDYRPNDLDLRQDRLDLLRGGDFNATLKQHPDGAFEEEITFTAAQRP